MDPADPQHPGAGDPFNDPDWCPGEDLEHGLHAALFGLAGATFGADHVVRVQEEDLTQALSLLDRVADQARALAFTLASEALTRGLHTSAGMGLVDWLACRMPSLPRAEVADLARVATAAQRPMNGPLADAVGTGEVPLRQAAIVSTALEKISATLTPDQYQAYLEIVLAAVRDNSFTDRQVHQMADRLLATVLDDAEQERRERAAHQMRSVTSRTIGRGLTRFTIDAPAADAAVISGILSSRLAAPVSTPEEPDTRSAGQRKFDALMSVIGRGLAAPDAAPTRPRASLLITMTLDGLLGRTGDIGYTATGQSLTPGQVRQLACEAEVIPIVLGTSSEVLDVGRAQRFATPPQVKALTIRDKGCTFPGCTIPAIWCIAHHVTYWSHGGSTDLSNLALLCQRHHTVVHQRHHTATVDPAGVTWHV